MIPIPYAIDCNKGYRIDNWVVKGSKDLDSFFTANHFEDNFYYLRQKTFWGYYNIDYNVEMVDNYLNTIFKLEEDTTLFEFVLRKYSIR